MKKISLIAVLFFFFANVQTFANETINPTIDEIIKTQENDQNKTLEYEKEEIIEQPIILEPQEIAPEIKEEINPYSKEALKGIIEKEYSLNDPSGLFKEQLTKKFSKGIIKSTTFQMSSLMNFTQTIKKDSSDFIYDYNTLNLGLKGKFRSEKENYNILLNATPDVHQNFFGRFVLDAWISTKRIPNHTVTFGTYRPCVGMEGAQSAFLVPFIQRSQIARNFGNIRKTGLKVAGDYKYLDYEIGGYSADTWYREFFPGVEANMWANVKPLANLDKNKVGTLKIGGGYSAGEKHSKNYNIYQAGMRYEYKNFWMSSEFAYADGSNGASGLTTSERWGYNITLAYRITKKLEALLRFDDFDNKKSIAKNNTREYSAGINYYIFGQALRLVLNYVYCQNQAKADSHKIIIGTQILL